MLTVGGIGFSDSALGGRAILCGHLALLITGIIAACENLIPKATPSLNWGSLLGWSLPCVSFAALVVSPATEVPNPVFVVWICILVTAWTTDYVLKSTEEAHE